MRITIHGKHFFVNQYYGSLMQKIRQFFVWNLFFKSFWHKVKSNKWEPDTFAVFNKFLDTKHSYIDIGAWIGPTVLYGCQIAKHCYAIEPDPVALKSLKENIKLNKQLEKKITVFNCCIGNSCGQVKLSSRFGFGDSTSSLLSAKSKKTISVHSITLEEFLKLNKIVDCNFIKMDIEGGELIVLPNIKEYLKKYKPTLFISLHPFRFENLKGDSEKIVNVLKIYKYIFDSAGNRLDLDKLYSLLLSGRGYDVIATDKNWN